jgi:tetratricopeptide (TPR) repeat protein
MRMFDRFREKHAEEDWHAWYIRGYSLDESGRFVEALNCYDKALRLNPEAADVWNNKGIILDELGRFDEAISCFEKAIRSNPNDDYAWNNKGFTLSKLDRHEEAISCYDESLKINPKYVIAWENKIASLAKLEMYEEAIKCCDKVLEINPEDDKVWCSKGSCLMMLGKYKEAIICLDKSLKMKDNDEVRGYRKFCLSVFGLPEEAVSNQKIIEEKKPAFKKQTKTRYEVGDKIVVDVEQYEVTDVKMGGMGEVHIVTDLSEKDPEWKTQYAVKIFKDELVWNENVVKRFLREAETLVKLDLHKNIAKVKTIREIGGRLHIFSEYIDGSDLSYWIENKMLGVTQSIDFAIQFCNGMEHAYNKMGLIHRDIKPSNIMITKNKVVKITDFGLAKTLVDSTVGEIKGTSHKDPLLTGIGNAMGTLLYMPPEQFIDVRSCDSRSDIYSFGVVMYEMLTAKLPFYGKTFEELKYKHLKIQPKRPKMLNSSIPIKLDSIVVKCLEKDPKNRYQSFGELRENLKGIYTNLTGKKYEEPKDMTKESVLMGFFEKIKSKDSRVLLEVESLNNRGMGLDEVGKHDEAIELFNKALEIDKKCRGGFEGSILLNKGRALYNLGKFKGSVKCYDRALKVIDPKDTNYATLWNNRGNSLKELGRHKESMKCYDKCLEIDPRNYMAWNNKGLSLEGEFRYEEAIKCYDECLNINPKYILAWFNKGFLLQSLVRDDEAISCYDKALEIDQRDARLWNNKGFCLSDLEEYDTALKCFDTALRIDPTRISAWINKGACLYSLRRYEEALGCYQRALQIDPQEERAKLGIKSCRDKMQ